MTKGKWDSSRTQSESHPIKAHDRFFRTEVDAEKYRTFRNARGRAVRNGYPRTIEGVERFLAQENIDSPPTLTDAQKIAKIKDLINSDSMTLAEFGHHVVNIIEDRS